MKCHDFKPMVLKLKCSADWERLTRAEFTAIGVHVSKCPRCSRYLRRHLHKAPTDPEERAAEQRAADKKLAEVLSDPECVRQLMEAMQ